MADWPSTWPSASCAVTAKNGPAELTVTVVSKPLRCWEPTLASASAVFPASTVQVFGRPVQLAYTTEPPAGFARAAAAGLSVGCAVQAAVKAR